jgi:phosphatidate cytidylyltransferase
VLNVGVTVLGVAYVGLLGSFAALLLKWPNDNGIGLLLGAVIATVGYDVGGFFIGRRIGQSPLAPEVSPHKTYEGLVGGMAVSVLVSVGIVSQIGPWDFGSALALGVMASIVAPLGDLSESMLKRDLGIKDAGGVLPGHGGLLDRFDGLLFVLPATYYLARVLDLGLG